MAGYETWPPDAWKTSGGVNDWGGLALDAARGMVFVPTGSPSFDFYGGDRHGDNLYANCLIAINANTGERVWHFQFVRHDLWGGAIQRRQVLSLSTEMATVWTQWRR